LAGKSGRHPAAVQVVVRVTKGAQGDLEDLFSKDPQIVRWALKKMLLLERDPEAGEALVGDLVGFRKLTVGDRHWRLVWRLTHDQVGRLIVDVAEVWAVGARVDSEVYTDLAARVRANEDPRSVPLAELIERLGKHAAGLEARAEPEDNSPPDWLRQALVRVVGLDQESVERMSRQEAEAQWEAFTTSPP
jgi:mRNA interferase RelE/StbE